MGKFLKNEYKRVTHSMRFWISLAVGCVISLLQFIFIASKHSNPLVNWSGIGVRYPHPWYEYWLGGEWYSLFSYTFYMIFPILASITLGDSIVQDKITGYSKLLYTRGNRKDYYIARWISSFLCGGIVIIVPLLLNILLCAAFSPSVLSQASTGTASIFATSMWSRLYYTHPMIYTIIYLFIDFIFGGLFAVFATSLGVFTRNRFLPLIFPFIIYLFSYTMCSSLQLWQYAPFNYLAPAQRVFGISAEIITIEAILLMVVTVVLFFIGMKTDETI